MPHQIRYASFPSDDRRWHETSLCDNKASTTASASAEAKDEETNKLQEERYIQGLAVVVVLFCFFVFLVVVVIVIHKA